MNAPRDFLVGCSFTDPVWQSVTPWSVVYGRDKPSYIVAKAGMGIRGICTEAMYYMDTIQHNIDNMIIMLPNLWRMDIELDVESQLCSAMVDLVLSNSEGFHREQPATRKWVTSGGLHYKKNTEQAKIFDFLYQYQGFLVIAKEHFRALHSLLDHCRRNNIDYCVTAIQDPLDQLVGLDYIRSDIMALLQTVEYDRWLRFNGQFIDKFLQHNNHPNNKEHEVLCWHIQQHLKKGR